MQYVFNLETKAAEAAHRSNTTFAKREFVDRTDRKWLKRFLIVAPCTEHNEMGILKYFNTFLAR